MLTYGDGVADVDCRALLEFHRAHGKLATVTAVRPPARFGGLVFDGDLVSEFTEKPQIGEGWINGGFFVLEPRRARLHRRRRDDLGARAARAARRRTASSSRSGTTASGSRWTPCATSGSLKALWQSGDGAVEAVGMSAQVTSTVQQQTSTSSGVWPRTTAATTRQRRRLRAPLAARGSCARWSEPERASCSTPAWAPAALRAELAVLGWTVSGVDASAEMVEAARARLPEAAERLHIGPHRVSFRSRPRASTSSRRPAFSSTPMCPRRWPRCSRVLRPGGRAVVSYPNPHAIYGIWKTRVWYPGVRRGSALLRRPNPQMPHGAGELPQPAFRAALAPPASRTRRASRRATCR